MRPPHIAYDKALLIPAMVVMFAGMLFSCWFFWDE